MVKYQSISPGLTSKFNNIQSTSKYIGTQIDILIDTRLTLNPHLDQYLVSTLSGLIQQLVESQPIFTDTPSSVNQYTWIGQHLGNCCPTVDWMSVKCRSNVHRGPSIEGRSTLDYECLKYIIMVYGFPVITTVKILTRNITKHPLSLAKL